MTRGMLSQTKTRIDQASNDDRIVNVPLTLVMQVYGLSYSNARRAVQIATARARKAKTLPDLEQRAEQDRLVCTCRTAEEQYPNITVEASRGTSSHAAIGKRFKITRERVRQINEAVTRLSRILGKSCADVASMAARGKLPSTHRDDMAGSTAQR